MGQLLSNPSSVPVSVAADWETLLNVNSAGNVGFNAISLQNWDSGTLAPAIAAGSMIEINGSIAYFQNQEAIGGIQTGVNYLQFVVSGTTVTPSWTLTAPAWNADKAGWFVGSNRASGHVCYQSGGAYSEKHQRVGAQGYHNMQAGENIFRGTVYVPNGNIVAGLNVDVTGHTISKSFETKTTSNRAWVTSGTEGTVVFPVGIIIGSLDLVTQSSNVYVQIKDTGGTWRTIVDGADGPRPFFFISDGTNYRYVLSESTGSSTISYMVIT
jgi:hypothetical protein